MNVFTEWLWADYLLYDHFKEKFAKEIETFGRHRLEHEKEILKRAIDYKKEICIEAEVDNSLLPKEDRLFGANVMGYKLKKDTGDESCPYYTMKEVTFLDYLRMIQTNKSHAKLKDQGVENFNNENTLAYVPKVPFGGPPHNKFQVDILKENVKLKAS